LSADEKLPLDMPMIFTAAGFVLQTPVVIGRLYTRMDARLTVIFQDNLR